MVNELGKFVIMINAISGSTGDTISTPVAGQLDTKGFKRARIFIISTTQATNKPAATLKLSESDDTTTTVTDIVAFTGGTATSTSAGFVIPAPSSATTVSPYLLMDVELRGRKRYLSLTIAPASTQTFTVVGMLSRGEQWADTAGEAGLSGAIVSG
jgi:hypothetical protein